MAEIIKFPEKEEERKKKYIVQPGGWLKGRELDFEKGKEMYEEGRQRVTELEKEVEELVNSCWHLMDHDLKERYQEVCNNADFKKNLPKRRKTLETLAADLRKLVKKAG